MVLVLGLFALGASACGEGRGTRSARDGALPCGEARRLPSSSATRRSIAEAILRTESVDLYVDPRTPGVVVPPRLRSDAGVVLRMGRDLPLSTPDLYVDDELISGTLSFDGKPFFCEVPWPAVFAIVSTHEPRAVWADGTPSEFLCEHSRGDGQVAPR